MKQIAPVVALMLALGIGIGASGADQAYAQQGQDPRVADLIQAARLRVGIGLGTPALAIKNPTTGEIRGPAVELGRALAARVGIDFVAIE
jgi:ABC-type amino acid transport substrate-binding protein